MDFSGNPGICRLTATNPNMVHPRAIIQSSNISSEHLEAITFLLLGSTNVSFFDDNDTRLGDPILISSWEWETKCLGWPSYASHVSFTAMQPQVSLDSIAVHATSCSTLGLIG